MNSKLVVRTQADDDDVDVDDVTLYTDSDMTVDVGVFTSGTGTGKIVGYSVVGGTDPDTPPEITTVDATNDGFTVEDGLTGAATPGSARANVGTDGMASLKAGSASLEDDVGLTSFRFARRHWASLEPAWVALTSLPQLRVLPSTLALVIPPRQWLQLAFRICQQR